jgi:hypothetical protein
MKVRILMIISIIEEKDTAGLSSVDCISYLNWAQLMDRRLYYL